MPLIRQIHPALRPLLHNPPLDKISKISHNLCHALTHSFVETLTSFSGSRIIINSNDAESEAENQPDNGRFVIIWDQDQSLILKGFFSHKPVAGVARKESSR